ncbi:ABC transporter ATP-binding protein [Enteractinococcus helveticum]|uniref:Multidrug ABC transporter ATP-binding protein n=1 Tax=Enteractinococcus helveticum TaxID=1837282 RepID=A0A1B7LYU9_9MICC|nr:ABC transporter ATP-binding protein [Enteractinococcus helveticum]OAV60562.1 multidrug ABC transporter ATP-binding protein [Enteractinococcus helveticum]
MPPKLADSSSVHASSAVTIRNLRIKRGRTVVFDGLNLEIPRGQITGLLGPSGCGKTTLMRAVVGVQKIQGGTVEVLGQPAGTRALRRLVSYDTQAASVYDDLTVRQNLEYFARIVGADREETERVAQEVGLSSHMRSLVVHLSGGQRSRVSLAVTLLGEPELIVLDEPTVGLDPTLRQELWMLFRSLAESGITVLVTSHVMDEASRCDRLLLLRNGSIIADTTPTGLLEDTGTDNPDAAFLALITRSEGPSDQPHGKHAAQQEPS